MAGITIENLTNTQSEGTFDKLLSAIRSTILEEYKNNRITGIEYSKIFMSSVDSVLNQSIAFTLQKDTVSKQLEILEAQRLLAVSQRDEIIARTSLVAVEIQKATAELALITPQLNLIAAQVILTTAQSNKTDTEAELLEIEKTKTNEEVLMIQSARQESIKKMAIMDAEILNIPKQGTLIDKNILKTEEETLFLTQRIRTEAAQINDSVDSATVQGIVGKQKDLYTAQTLGFTRDAEFKVFKSFLDTWIARRSTDETLTEGNTVNKLSDVYIGLIATKCLTSLGITVP